MTATRRLAAILAADVAGYSRLMGADEEGTLAALKALRREMADPKIEEHRGRIVKTTGDGLLVEFASVVDAVRCAVEIQREMTERNANVPAERRIEFRIGINLGDVILDDGDIYGDGVNIGARLETLAEPGEICVSRVVRDQVRDKLDISFEDGGEQRVKNIARPLHIYRISIPRHVSPPTPQKGNRGFAIAHPEASTVAPADAFVGRQRELEVLRGAFEHACAGHGRIVMLAGEPGIGKTRTAQELARHAAQREAAVLWGRCHEESGAPPYWPWVQVIRALLHDADPDLLAGLGAAACDIADIVPEVRDRLPELERSAPLGDPSEARFRMFESIRQLFASLCRHRALLIVLDDVHWADAPSLRLLEFLARELGGSRILLVGTYRATELSRQHPLSNALGGLTRVAHFARLNLAGLSEEEVQAFIAAAATTAPAGLAKTLHDQTEGNPLFLREIVRFLEQRGAIGAGQDSEIGALPSAIRIPEGVTEVIGRRLNFLSAGCNEVLALASVIGRDFAWEVLVRAAAPLSEDMLLEALDEAVAAHIVEETAAGRYQFTHNLIRMTLYDELRISRRRQFHRAVGNAIETVYRADLDPFLPELARHFQASGHDVDGGRAIDYATRAGRRADALLAFEDAVQFFQTALDVLEQRPQLDQTTRCSLLLRLGEALRKSGDSSQALATLRAAFEAATELSQTDTAAQAALAYEQTAVRAGLSSDPPPEQLLEEALRQVPETEPALRARLSGALGRALLYASAEAEARAQVARAIAMARRVGDPAVLAANLSHLFNFFGGPESAEELLSSATEMVAAARQSGDLEMVHIAHSWRLPLYLELGDMAAVEAELDALTRVDARVRQRTYSIYTLTCHLMVALLRGEFAGAERLILDLQVLLRGGPGVHVDQVSMQIFTLRREQGRLAGLQPVVSAFLRQHAAASVWRPGLALIYLELGQRDEARAEYEKLAADDFAAMPRDGRWLFCMVYLSEVCAALGDAARAAVLYRLILPYAGRNIVLGAGIACCGSADRYLGLLCTTMGRCSEAQRHFEQALAMNARIGARVALAHTQHDYAAMLLACSEAGDRERATGLLRTSLEHARGIGMRMLEERAAGRLDELSGPSAPDDLTAREAEVLRLIAIGRSNADIALALSISLNTVATHVRNILAKTGCANRTEAAAYAMRRGLGP
jgi:class 3 adenylate cyclase/ATP/maltotriose-dependent transcriptional regulator MalT